MDRRLAAALAITCMAFSSQGTASPVTWQFTGTVDQGDIPGLFFPITVVPGDSITIDLTLERATPCSLCSSTLDQYQNPLTALSFTANGKIFAFPLISSSLTLAKDEPAPPGHNDFLNLFDLNFNGFDSGLGVRYGGALALQSAFLMPPVPGINDIHLANLALPNPADFASQIPDVDVDFFDVSATPNGSFFDGFGGRMLSSSNVSVPEPSTLPLWVAGLALALLLGPGRLAHVRRGRRAGRE